MIVYRIAEEQYANDLKASGAPNRWNKSQQFVLYASESVSLCALELLAHTSGVRPRGIFKVMHIELTRSAKILEPDPNQLPKDWPQLSNYPVTQKLGSDWYEASQYLVMKIPSAIVPAEWNYAINCRFADFEKLAKIVNTENFIWDHRFPEG